MLLHSVMDRVSEHTTNKQKMDEFSMVYYNNLLVGRGGGWQEPGQGSLVCWAAGEGEGGVDPAGGGREGGWEGCGHCSGAITVANLFILVLAPGLFISRGSMMF